MPYTGKMISKIDESAKPLKGLGLAVLMALFLWACNNPKPENHSQTPDTVGKAGSMADTLTLVSESLQLKIALKGSSICYFITDECRLNPFTWALTTEQMPKNNIANGDYRFAGHFICAGRWGSPSEAEILAGIPHNGEVNSRTWTLLTDSVSENWRSIKTQVELPFELVKVTRVVSIPSSGYFVKFSETFTNTFKLARPYNVVQHATLGQPFIDTSNLVITNATLGYDQKSEIANYERESFTWPNAQLIGKGKHDLRFQNSKTGFVTSHIFDTTQKLGYIVAFSPKYKQLIGYLFDSRQYPWANIWSQYDSSLGNLWALGLEFGTTGSGEPYKSLIDKYPKYKGINQYFMLDANESKSFDYVLFMRNIDSLDLQSTIEILNDSIVLNNGTFGKVMLCPKNTLF